MKSTRTTSRATFVSPVTPTADFYCRFASLLRSYVIVFAFVSCAVCLPPCRIGPLPAHAVVCFVRVLARLILCVRAVGVSCACVYVMAANRRRSE